MSPAAVRLILASASPWRATMLKNAGLAIETIPANIDERAIEAALDGTGTTPKEVALILSQAKAQEVSERHPSAFVIGSDQTLSFNDEILHKPANMEEAARRLLLLSGQTHILNSAVALANRGETVWSHVATSRITFRTLDPGFIGRHLAAVGKNALGSVGAYQIEGMGAQLIETFEGDFFSVIGLPLLPVLEELRQRKLIDG